MMLSLSRAQKIVNDLTKEFSMLGYGEPVPVKVMSKREFLSYLMFPQKTLPPPFILQFVKEGISYDPNKNQAYITLEFIQTQPENVKMAIFHELLHGYLHHRFVECNVNRTLQVEKIKPQWLHIKELIKIVGYQLRQHFDDIIIDQTLRKLHKLTWRKRQLMSLFGFEEAIEEWKIGPLYKYYLWTTDMDFNVVAWVVEGVQLYKLAFNVGEERIKEILEDEVPGPIKELDEIFIDVDVRTDIIVLCNRFKKLHETVGLNVEWMPTNNKPKYLSVNGLKRTRLNVILKRFLKKID